MDSNTDLLLIFTRNPELGKCKTRLATKVGDRAALNIYKFLLEHTVHITQQLAMDKSVYYSEEVWKNDIWNNDVYQKKLQQGTDLGQRMMNAFVDGFRHGYQKIVIIGSDMYNLTKEDIEEAFSKLAHHDVVLGPAEDGGYYLLGMKKLNAVIFQNKDWGTSTVLKATLNDLNNENYLLLPLRNDVDHYEDIQHIEAFQPFLKHLKK
ncbi:MAG: TIGR04282 family arsenosugar biosynthesis glycosyltransferase [Bacteroidota bacterium]